MSEDTKVSAKPAKVLETTDTMRVEEFDTAEEALANIERLPNRVELRLIVADDGANVLFVPHTLEHGDPSEVAQELAMRLRAITVAFLKTMGRA